MLRPRKKIHVFPLLWVGTHVGRKKILFLLIFLARFYKGHIRTLIVLIQKKFKWSKKL